MRHLYRVVAGDQYPRGYILGVLAGSLREAITIVEQAYPKKPITSVRLEYDNAWLLLRGMEDSND